MKLRCLIIDDEPDAVKVLSKILEDFCRDKTEVVGVASNSVDGMKLINRSNPDLLFLDIEMPGASGFDLIDLQQEIDFGVVFVTAYDRHALKAIKYKPDGYLLKPVDITELVTIVDQLHKEKLDQEGTGPLSSGKYCISIKEETVLVDFDEMLYIRAEGRYSYVHMTNTKAIRVCKNIGGFEKELLRKGFVRCHKSYLVNPRHIVRLDKTDGGFIEISNGTTIEISRRKRQLLFGKG